MKAIAPGKLILSGEHAVVYGRPALAMAIDRSAQVVVTPGEAAAGVEDGEVSFNLQNLSQSERFTVRALRELRHRVLRSYRQFLQGEIGIREVLRKPVDLFEFSFIMLLDGLHLKLNRALDIRLQSNIPIGCGLGSSAASILSVLRGVGHYFRVEFRPDWYYEYSLEAEKMQHGFPSGVDSYISVHGGCAKFQNGQAVRIPLPRTPIALVNTGTPSCTTGECVAAVRQQFGSSGIWDEFEAVTLALEQALQRNDTERIHALIRENHRLLDAIGVVPPKVREFIAEVEKTGGAAKICGAGAVSGENAGAVMICGPRPSRELLDAFGYPLVPIRGEPLGVRIV